MFHFDSDQRQGYFLPLYPDIDCLEAVEMANSFKAILNIDRPIVKSKLETKTAKRRANPFLLFFVISNLVILIIIN
jgi:hypothetical protein